MMAARRNKLSTGLPPGGAIVVDSMWITGWLRRPDLWTLCYGYPQ
jgi:hypothetical protein